MSIRLLISVSFLLASVAQAQVITDGSLGPQVSLSGDFTIAPSLGRQQGQNLYHSFAEFHVETNESATFTGNVENIFARVTGGDPTQIDGSLNVQGNAHLWMLNPAGTIISNSGSVQVESGVTFFAGEALAFADGAIFSTRLSANSTLSMAAPSEWQSGSAVMPIIVNGSIAAGTDGSVRLIGQNILLSNADITAADGNITIASLDASPQMIDSLNKRPGRGLVDIIGSTIDASGSSGGRVEVVSHELRASEQSLLQADARGPEVASGQVLLSGDVIVVNNATVAVDDTGQAGGSSTDPAISIEGGNVTIADGARVTSTVFGSGNLGRDIAIQSDQLTVSALADADVTEIAADVLGSGVGGDILINTTQLNLVNATIAADGFGEASGGEAAAGGVKITAQDIRLEGSALISSAARGGASVRGSVDIAASGNFSMRSSGDQSPSVTVAERDAANAATGAQQQSVVLRIRANTLDVGGGVITAATTGDAQTTGATAGGQLEITANRIDASGLRVSSRTDGAGEAGNIVITGSELVHLHNSQITASAEQADGGNINIQGLAIALNNSELSARAENNGGNITIGNTSDPSLPLTEVLVADGVFEADAINASGGNIQISAKQIGTTRRSTYDASSLFGTNGTVNFSALQSEQPQQNETIASEASRRPRELKDDCGKKAASGASGESTLRIAKGIACGG